jgi:hypothetical protein
MFQAIYRGAKTFQRRKSTTPFSVMLIVDSKRLFPLEVAKSPANPLFSLEDTEASCEDSDASDL